MKSFSYYSKNALLLVLEKKKNNKERDFIFYQFGR